jgi:hypothetical protein
MILKGILMVLKKNMEYPRDKDITIRRKNSAKPVKGALKSAVCGMGKRDRRDTAR